MNSNQKSQLAGIGFGLFFASGLIWGMSYLGITDDLAVTFVALLGVSIIIIATYLTKRY